MSEVKNIMIVGVGGQGTLLASKLVGEVAVKNGFDTKVSEVHGMSQRGGSVVTYVRYGSEVYSPIIDLGEADIVLSFELLEAARYVSNLKKDGVMIVADQKIDPMPVITGAAKYPENLEESIRNAGVNLICFDALSIAEKCGNAKSVNVVLIAQLARKLSFKKEDWIEAIKNNVPAKFLDINLNAFEMSYNMQ